MPGPKRARFEACPRPARPSDHRGKVVVLNLRGSWCNACRAEAERLRSLRDPDPEVPQGEHRSEVHPVQHRGGPGRRSRRTGVRRPERLAGDGTLAVFGKCLDVSGGGPAVGTRVQLWDCTRGNAQQGVSDPGGGLRNPVSGRCLAGPDQGDPFAQPVIQHCTVAAISARRPRGRSGRTGRPSPRRGPARRRAGGP
ncbi:hypothetical protein KNE206_48380 [Kitasatospora sp. NE20-6]|uniref:ricin-type beta-trefoil lectin domain protein n=1 Tax=Kitasatospora sp. NE20-6 TaxID=2859066 RepID=UPI0034DBBDE9